LLQRPPEGAQAVDPLSDVLEWVRLRGAVYFDVGARAPWAAEAPESTAFASYLARGDVHVVEFHVVVQGACWAGIVDGPATRLETGDVIVFPHGDAHVLSSAPGMRAPFELALYDQRPRALPIALRNGGEGAVETRVICGFFTCDRQPFNPLIAALPRVLHDSASGRRGLDGAWIARFIEQAVAESSRQRPGNQALLTKLSELMFLDVVRRYLSALPDGHTGWLAALRDPLAGRAISLMHDRPEHPWTVEELARASGASRSLLAERFTEVVGMAPMQYLAQWRIQVAAGLLAESEHAVAEIAAKVGYESEAAFNRAFKKAVGMPPGTWRRDRSAGTRRPARRRKS
jgi:AraC-like DNA-binding protein